MFSVGRSSGALRHGLEEASSARLANAGLASPFRSARRAGGLRSSRAAGTFGIREATSSPDATVRAAVAWMGRRVARTLDACGGLVVEFSRFRGRLITEVFRP